MIRCFCNNFIIVHILFEYQFRALAFVIKINLKDDKVINIKDKKNMTAAVRVLENNNNLSL